MPDNNPIADVQVKDCRLAVVQITWKDGMHRTIATSKAADLVSVGIMVKGGASPQEIEAAFPGRIVAEPRGLPDVLRRLVEGSEN